MGAPDRPESADSGGAPEHRPDAELHPGARDGAPARDAPRDVSTRVDGEERRYEDGAMDRGGPDGGSRDSATPIDGSPDDGSPDDGPSTCADPFEPNEVCAAAHLLGEIREGGAWTSQTGTSSPVSDADWFKVVAREEPNWCFPYIPECFRLKVRLDVPGGRKLRLCLLRDACTAPPICADNMNAAGPVQLQVQYQVNGACSANDDTTALFWVEQLDSSGECDQYTVSFNYDVC